MKVLFAVSNEKMSEAIIKQYQKEYKEIITSKNVYYFNAILKELQRDKTYDRVVISEDLEQSVNSDSEQTDNFIFGRLDSISDEASNIKGEDIPIILICDEKRTRGESILIKLFGIGIYNAIIGNDRSINEVCRLIKRPRLKKEAKLYYKIDSEDVIYEKDDENEVDEVEIQNILMHYQKIGSDEQKIVDSFDSIAAQYNNYQLRIICRFLPENVKKVLDEKSPRYMQINSFKGEISDDLRNENQSEKGKKNKKQDEKENGTSERMLEIGQNKKINEPIVIPNAMSSKEKRKIVSAAKKAEPSIIVEEKELKVEKKTTLEQEKNTIINVTENDQVQPVKRGRGRPKKIVEEVVIENAPKRKRGRPRKKEVEEESVLPGLELTEEENSLPEIEDTHEAILPGLEEDILPGFENVESEESILPGFENAESEESVLPGFEEENILDNIDEELTEPSLNDAEDDDSIQDTKYENVLNDLRNENILQESFNVEERRRELPKYDELDVDKITRSNQKIVSFVGTSKNGTSFLVNNIAEILSTNNIKTAIVDLTKNRSSYYIYTKNEENLRIKANGCFKKLRDGIADGIETHKNLTVYTSVSNVDDIEHVEPIIETLVNTHDIVILDCDFDTPERYFKYSTEIYLVQSMDILTIQPLTAFVKKIENRGCFDRTKAKVVLNMFNQTKYLNENILVGGVSIYNDPEMTYRKELFDRKKVGYLTIPFDRDALLGYLDGLVICDVTLKNFNPKKSKYFLQALKDLAKSVYGSDGPQNKGKYVPPSMKNM